jgi:hypothetical protein
LIEVQMLKFGQIINLETLEKNSINKPAEELKEKLERVEQERLLEIENFEAKIRKLEDQFQVVLNENTKLVRKLSELSDSQSEMDTGINFAEASVSGSSYAHILQKVAAQFSSSQKQQTRVEEDSLRSVAKSQFQEIKMLKEEISLLRSKGSVYM